MQIELLRSRFLDAASVAGLVCFVVVLASEIESGWDGALIEEV